MLTDETFAGVRDLISGLNIGLYDWRPQDDHLVWSPELLRIYGLDRAPRSEREFGALIHPEDRVRVEGETAFFLTSDAKSYSHSFRIVRSDSAVRVILDRGTITRDGTGRVTLIRGVNIDVTEEADAAAHRLQTSEARYRKLFEAIDAGFCVVEVRFAPPGGGPDAHIDYRVIEANPAFYTSTGFPRAILNAWLREAAPGLEEHWFQTYGAVARTGQPARFESHSELLGRWFDVYAFPFDNPADNRVAILFNDISARKRQEEQTQQLMHEVNHRSKNTLGMVLAIARLSATAGAPGFLDRFGARLRSLSASHDLLVRNEWAAVQLADLLQTQLSPFTDLTGQRVTIAGPPISLNDVATKALGMAFHELATNSAKYGALSNETGHISINWSLEDTADADPRVAITWQESGGPPLTSPTKKGFGTALITQMAENDTGGTVTIDYAAEGASWRISCPASKILAPA